MLSIGTANVNTLRRGQDKLPQRSSASRPCRPSTVCSIARYSSSPSICAATYPTASARMLPSSRTTAPTTASRRPGVNRYLRKKIDRGRVSTAKIDTKIWSSASIGASRTTTSRTVAADVSSTTVPTRSCLRAYSAERSTVPVTSTVPAAIRTLP